ncbi:MAG TPA: hypothetical protein VH478_26530 [Trebonia sp.]|nr:hypothetical protein [Trebonia sp.]
MEGLIAGAGIPAGRPAFAAITVPGEIVMYLRAFDRLAELAVYDADARALISSAMTAAT